VQKISRHTARHPRRALSLHAAQVLRAAMDFRRDDAARLAMQLKHLKRRIFSLPSVLREARFAFGLP
jgi:hypothetical protein